MPEGNPSIKRGNHQQKHERIHGQQVARQQRPAQNTEEQSVD